jgi:anthranilate phosphoribosyltransferase
MKEYLEILAGGGVLSRQQAALAMENMLTGVASPEATAGLLMGLRSRGETTDELVGFTETMRRFATPVRLSDPDAIDLCGTGGDGSGTFNISTAAAFVCAGAGVTVAKHGNRSVSSQAGSADVLEVLGVNVELGAEGVEQCLERAGIAFLFAPFFHPAMRFVMPVRRALAVRTFFNILGPLCNPAGVRRQLVGAFDAPTAGAMASILAALGAERVVAVHADDGLDEFSLAAETTVFQVEDGKVAAPSKVKAEDHRIAGSPLEALHGGTAVDNARIIAKIFAGEPGPARDVVLLNAAYALWTSGRFESIDHAISAAEESIDSGSAREAVRRLAEESQRAPGPQS